MPSIPVLLFDPGSFPTPLYVVAASYGFVDGVITKFSLALYLSHVLSFGDIGITDEMIPHHSQEGSMIKPILYHDVDGVLFGEYGPRKIHQLRPGVNDWFHWVLARYELVFLTSWTEHDLRLLLHSLYLDHVNEKSRILPWDTVGLSKWEALKKDQAPHPHPFFWIDDQGSFLFPDPAIQSQYFNGLPFVTVNSTGSNQLEDLMQRLNARQKKLSALLAQTGQTPLITV